MAEYEFCIKQCPPSITDYMKNLEDELLEGLTEKVRESLYQFIEKRNSLYEELQGSYF